MPEKIIKTIRQAKRKIGLKATDDRLYCLAVENPVFCGACLIFTDKYIENEKVIFEPDTGFYLEELCLSLKCELKHYQTVYTPEIQVIHHSQTATKLVITNAKDRERFAIEKTLHAYDVYRKYYFDMIATNGESL